jgi:hypothetical protein
LITTDSAAIAENSAGLVFGSAINSATPSEKWQGQPSSSGSLKGQALLLPASDDIRQGGYGQGTGQRGVTDPIGLGVGVQHRLTPPAAQNLFGAVQR